MLSQQAATAVLAALTAIGPVRQDSSSWTLHGQVVSASSGDPVVGAVVSFTRNEMSGRLREARTDGSGKFELQLSGDDYRPGSCWTARVEDRAGARETERNVRLFFDIVPLVQDMVIAVDDARTMRGQLVGLDESIGGPLSMRVFADRASGPDSALSIGYCEARSDGRFEVRAALAASDQHLELELSMEDAVIGSVGAPVSALLSQEGGRIPVALAHLECHVADEAGKALPEVVVGVAPVRRQIESPVAVQTDEAGKCELTLLAGNDFDLVSGAPGHAASLQSIVPKAGTTSIEIVLRNLKESDVVTGRVSLADGKPAARARVVAGLLPRAEVLAQLTFAAGESNDEGAFTIPLAGNAPVFIQATFEGPRLGGFAPTSLYQAERRGFVLGIEPLALTVLAHPSLELDLAAEGVGGPFHAGAARYVLVESRTQESISGVDVRLPMRINSLPAGEYEVWIGVTSCEAIAQASAKLRPGKHAKLRATARPARWIEGTVHDASGKPASGLRVVANSTWPPKVAEVLGAATTDAFGHFRAMTSGEDVELEIRDGERVVDRRSAKAGSAVDVTLH